jgi:secreted trypsin-like serine protease
MDEASNHVFAARRTIKTWVGIAEITLNTTFQVCATFLPGESATYDGPCLGDNGGPLFCQTVDHKMILIGTAANTLNCSNDTKIATKVTPGIFTLIYGYLDYLNSRNIPFKQLG